MKGEPVVFPASIVIDHQEKIPYEFRGFKADAADGGGMLIVPTTVSRLKTGDYSLTGLEDQVAVERKSRDDLFGTLGQHRERFERELTRLSRMRFAAIVVEASWSVIIDVWPKGIHELGRWLEQQAETANETGDGPQAVKLGRWLDALAELTEGPPQRSRLNPKTVFRSVLAWQQRFPNVHWNFVPGRRCGELFTLRTLERFWRERQREVGERCSQGSISSPG